MAEITVNGVRTWYEEVGTGEPVVLVHGLGGTGQDIWKKVLAELAETFRVVAYDLRGSGRSDAPPGPYTVEGPRGRPPGAAGRARVRAGRDRRPFDGRRHRARAGGS